MKTRELREPREPGRPRLPEGARLVKLSVTLTHTQIAWLRTHYRSTAAGVRDALDSAMKPKRRTRK